MGATKSTYLASLFALLASTATLAQTNPVPLINQPLAPMTAAPSGSGFTLTVNGTEFVSDSVVNWNGTALATTFVTDSQLTATVPASDIAAPATNAVTVTNPAPGGGTSNVMYFDVANHASSLVFSDFYSVFSNPAGSAIIAADFNGDGILDLASSVGVNQGGLLVIELGNGDGTFQSSFQYPVGINPQQLIAADFNGDGKLDLAVVANGGYDLNTVYILLGNGDGTFQAAKTFATGNYPTLIASGDFNGDGKLDLAVGCEGIAGSNGSISILLGNGDGTFQTHTDYTPPGEGLQTVSAMALGDFNGDGKLDIALIDGDAGALFILLGNGDGTFQFTSPAPTVGAVSMLTADVNGDGKLDLVLAQDNGEVAVLIGNGDGTFQSAVEYPSGGNNNLEVVAADFNADGKLDLATGNANSSTVAILLGNGDGTFQAPLTFPTEAPGCVVGDFCNPLALAAGDFNDDGKTDLAVILGNTSYDLLVLLQGTWPALAADPPSISFGQQNVDTASVSQAVSFTNTGNATFDISGIGITGANAADFSQNNNCGATLAPNASCQANVTFTPNMPGTLNAAVSVAGSSFKNPINMPITGVGYGAAASVSPATVTFPSQYVGASGLPQTVIVTNRGTAALAITNLSTSIADFGTLSNCTNSVPPNTNCTIGVFFDPRTSGTRVGTLTITDNASGSPQTVTLSGTGQDFSLAPSGQTTATITPGQTASYTVVVTPGGGFNHTVAMSCSGAPAQSTCSLSSSSVALNGSTAEVVNVTITTAEGSAGFAQPVGRLPYGGTLSWLTGTLALVTLLSLATWRRKLRPQNLYGLALLCLLLIGVTMSACGGGGSGGATSAGTYKLTVTGNFISGSATLTHTANLTLVVQ